jgi:hypothetical protein
LPARDTPHDAEAFPPRPDGPYSAAIADLAAAAWRSVTPPIAGTPHVRISRDGGRTYPARHARPLPADPPGQPCTVPVYDPGAATGRMLALDLDRARGDVDHQAAELVQLLERLGGRCIADVSPSGGRHVLVLFSAPLPWRELRDVARAVSQRFPAVDPAPMASLGGQISPPGARHKSGGWRTLPTPLSEARAAAEHPNGPEVWAALLTEFAAELQQVETGTGDDDFPGGSELDDIGVPWVPRLGGRAPLGAELERVARTGRGAGNNRAMSTATAFSFLNGPGVRCGMGWPSAGPERVVGVAGPLGDLAALVSLGLPGIPGPLQLRGRGSGQPPPGAEGPELQVRLGQPPAALRPPVGQHRGSIQVPDPPGPGELVHVSGDAVDDRRHPRQVDGHDGPVRPVSGRAQVDRRRVAAPVKLPQPARALPQPVHLVRQAVGEVIAAVQVSVLIAVRVFGGRPARCPQLTQRRYRGVQVGIGHELVHPGR